MKKKLLLAICLLTSLTSFGQTVDFDRAAKKMTITGLTAGTLGTIITDGTGGTENLRGATVNTIPDDNTNLYEGSTKQTVNDDAPIETLIVSGQLDGTDMKILADMARSWMVEEIESEHEVPGPGGIGTTTKYLQHTRFVYTGGLKHLDISGAQIVAGGIYHKDADDKYYYNGDAYVDAQKLYAGSRRGTPELRQGRTLIAADNEIGEIMFIACNTLESIILPSTVTKIGKKAFAYFDQMEEMTIPASVETIESFAFWQAFNMSTLRDGVPTTIIRFKGEDNKVSLEPDALSQYDNHSTMHIMMEEPDQLAAIESSMSLLSDYAVDDVIADNVKAGFVRGKAAPPNKYWTFSCGVDVVVPDGVDVYVTTINNGVADRRILTDSELDLKGVGKRVIPANNGVLLACPGDTGNAYDMVVQYNAGITSIDATKDAKSWGENANHLVPVIRTSHYESGQYYMLYHGKWVVLASDDAKVPAGKALLKK